MNPILKNIKLFFQNRIVQHILFWVLSFYILGLFFSEDYDTVFSKINLIYTFLFHLSIWLAVYPNLLIWIPTTLKERKFVQYFIVLIANIGSATFFNLLIFNDLSDYLFPNYYFIAYYDFLDILQFLLIYLVLTSLLKLSKSWFQQSENQRIINNLKKEKLDAELHALKSQINPHFLFNSLNNLYGLALDEDKKTPDVILQLSKSMRYMLYESNEDFVDLEKEIAFLNNYLALQKLRIDEKVNINFEVTGSPKEKKIAPLLLIPFVENAFKHGIKGDIENAFIKINLKIEKEQLIFKVENNKGIVDEIETNEFKGIGLKNVRKRLELLYAEKHKLKIIEKEKIYSIDLIINNL